MEKLFNDNWQFSEIALETKTKEILKPEAFFDQAQDQNYTSISVPHDWMIGHVKELYKDSVGCYKKSFELTQEEISGRRNAIYFEGVYMNCAIWLNGKKAGEWKYGYTAFEVDLTPFVKCGQNELLVIAVYQNCNTRWYSGAGIFRDVTYKNKPLTYLITNGTYIVNKPASNNFTNLLSEQNGAGVEDSLWTTKISVEVAGPVQGHKVITRIKDRDNNILIESAEAQSPLPVSEEEHHRLSAILPSLGPSPVYKTYEELTVTNPKMWDIEDPYFYTATTELLDKDGNVVDSVTQHCGFKVAVFDKNKGFFLNGNHVKIQGACHHHDHGVLGSAFSKNALKRQFLKLKEMGVNAIRCSHNPPPSAWMDLCDELGLLVDNEGFDMWENAKTPFDYSNYFDSWCEKDTAAWIRKDRNHPSLIMWSLGNEISDTNSERGFEITKRLANYVKQNDPEKTAPITIASNYMMTDGGQTCATGIDLAGYNYLEYLYDEHHQKYPEWKIYGSETSSTVQSRGIYHFPEDLRQLTFTDGQCSCLGNCSTNWGAKNTQTVITTDRDCEFSAGQFIWTGWDYIGEPTPYHSKNSFFGQIDTAGFEKDTFYLYKSEWAGKKAEPFVHLLPYWDWNEGQLIDVKAYTNASAVELIVNGESKGRQIIDHKKGKEPFGKWQVEYHKGEITAIGYDENGTEIARETKKSFGDPEKILLKPENYETGDLFFVDIMTLDKDDNPVENARNYITVNVAGNADLVGLDNGDSTDFDEYCPDNKTTHTRKLFANRLVAVIRAKKRGASFVLTAASEGLPNISIKYDGKNWVEAAPYLAVHPVEEYIPVRKIELSCEGSTRMNADNREISVQAKVWPENASDKTINWNCVLQEGVKSNNFEIILTKGTESIGSNGAALSSSIATLSAKGDGECILRCTAKNNTTYDEVFSDLNLSITGFGSQKLDPYQMIEACKMTDWEKSRKRPQLSFEGGVCSRGCGPLWISFDNVDFGPDESDTIHLPIFSFNTELPVEVWDGKPGCGTTSDGGAVENTETKSECLGKFTYRHESIYNTYNENVFTLSKKLTGVHTISIVLPYEVDFHGFYFFKSAAKGL